MRRIAVINQKGGVGKTTTTANLGAALAQAGKSVLLIDLDPQGHLSLHFGVEATEDQPGIYDVLTSGTPLADVVIHARTNADLICADIDLAAAEAELVSVTGREVLLREALDALHTPYDAVLFDCPPSLGVLTINALAAATEVVIPLQAHFLALQGLGKLLKTVTLVRQRINPQLKVTGVVLCMHEAATRLSAEVVADLSTFLRAAKGTGVAWADARVFETAIRRNIKLAESSSFGQTVFDYAPKSNGALDYAALAAEIFDLPVPRDDTWVETLPVEVKAVSISPGPVPLSCSGSGRECDGLATSEPGAAHKGRRQIKTGTAPVETEKSSPVNGTISDRAGPEVVSSLALPVRRPRKKIEKTSMETVVPATISME